MRNILLSEVHPIVQAAVEIIYGALFVASLAFAVVANLMGA